MKIVLITGASAGMGREFARQLDGQVHVDEFWLVARREERLESLAGELSHKVRIFAEDITLPEFPGKLETALREHDADIKILVNCAGFGVLGTFAESEMTDATGMVDLNCRALTAVTRCCIPYMRRNSRLIMAASSAAFVPQPNFAVYAATKSYVLSFSRALAEEVRPSGIYVTVFCPGPVATEFFDIAEKHTESYVYKKYLMLPTEKVVAEVIAAAKHRQTVVTPGVIMKLFRFYMKMIPHAIVLKISSKIK